MDLQPGDTTPSLALASPSQHRRLAPQRKKAAPLDFPKTDDTSSSSSSSYHLPVPVSQVSATASAKNVLPIIEASTLREEDSYRFDGLRDDGMDRVDDDFPMIGNSLADWTTNFNKNSGAKTQSNEEEKDKHCNYYYLEDEEADMQYGFELESSTSRSVSNDGLAGDDDDSENNDDAGDIFHISTEEQITLNPPPPTLPYVLVNLESLCGCQVSGMTEKLILVKQLTGALLGSSTRQEENNCQDNNNNTTTTEMGDEPRTKNSYNNVLGDGLSLDFDEGVIDLFGSGAASHADSSHPVVIACMAEAEGEAVVKNGSTTGCNAVEAKVITSYAVVPYPEFIVENPRPQHEQQVVTTATHIEPPKQIRSTLRLWKLLHTVPTQHPQISPLLSRIFVHLRNSSRSLLWKASMHYEISVLAKEEYALLAKRMRLQEYNDWRENVRGERLQKLYDVRETFLIQVEVARKKHTSLVEVREEQVERELRRRGLIGSEFHYGQLLLHTTKKIPRDKQDSIDYDNAFDVDPYDYDDDGWGGTVHEDEIIGEENMVIATTLGEDEAENDDWSPLNLTVNPLGMNVTVNGIATKTTTGKIIDGGEDIIDVASNVRLVDKPKMSISKLEPISHDDNFQRKSHRLQKKNEDRYLSSAKSIQQRHGFLRREQDSIRESLKTTDERIAEATLLKLEERLQNVDDLIEKLQEEEWADQEEEEDVDDDEEQSDRNHVDENEDAGKEKSSLLDSILAMILGALPKKMNSIKDTAVTDDVFYRNIKDEHDSIVQEWKNVFGRLPPFPQQEPEREPEQETTIETELMESNRALFGGMKLSEYISFAEEEAEVWAIVDGVWGDWAA